jgi:inner membrane transporter RhtA
MAPDAATRPAVLLVLSSIVSVQCGSALATTLFDTVGPGGAVLLRSAFAAMALLALAGRSLRSIRRHEVRDVLYFGIALAAMNASFYAAIDRIPLGVAVTIEFIGPLSVAILGSRRRRDIVWGLLAAVGVVLLSEGAEGGSIDALGVALALAAGACWGLYIVLSARVGGHGPGLGGLAIAVAISAVLVLPYGVADGGGDLFSVSVLAIGLAAGLLSSAIPYVFELEALRRLANAVFGVMMSLEPAVAAAVGFFALGQGLAAIQVAAVAMVVAASIGALRSASTPMRQEI